MMLNKTLKQRNMQSSKHETSLAQRKPFTSTTPLSAYASKPKQQQVHYRNQTGVVKPLKLNFSSTISVGSNTFSKTQIWPLL